jgi:hypothetical protein
MDAQHIPAFTKALDLLAAVFSADVSLEKKHGYWMALADYPLEAVEHACLMAMRTEPHFPVPAILRALAREYQHTQRAKARPVDLDLQERISAADVQALIASVWPEMAQRDAVDPWDVAQPEDPHGAASDAA